MNRRNTSLVVLAALTASLTMSVAGAEPKRMPTRVMTRTVSIGYNYARSSSEQPIEYSLTEPREITVGDRERWATVIIEDASTRPVGVQITQDVDGDGAADSEWTICGASDAPLVIVPDKPLTVTFVPDACSDEAGTATSGTVHVQLHSPALKLPPTRSERTLSFVYTGAYYETEGGFAAGGLRVDTSSTEGFLSINASDDSGLPPHLRVTPEHGRAFDVCGSTADPIAIEPANQLSVSLQPTPCPDGTPAAMTTGGIELTLSNRP